MTDYAPTTPEVNGIRDGWACTHVRDDITLEQAREAFDRWLASEKAEALRDAADAMEDEPIDTHPFDGLDETAAYLRRRADELEKS